MYPKWKTSTFDPKKLWNNPEKPSEQKGVLLSAVDVYSPKNIFLINDDIRVAELQAFCGIKGCLRDLLGGCSTVQANANEVKTPGIDYMFRRNGGLHVSVECERHPQYLEPLSSSAPEAALHKAWHLHNETGKPSAASDIFFYIHNEQTGKWEVQHKLERLKRELTSHELEQEIQEQHKFLVEGKHRRKAFWHPALALVNGSSSGVSDYVCVEFDPFIEEEFEAFMIDALSTGKFINSNARGRLIEYIIEFKKLRAYANIPYTFIETHTGNGNRVDVGRWMQEWHMQDIDAINMLIYQIVQALPHALRLMRHKNFAKTVFKRNGAVTFEV
ncbi:MAG: hypothetical protein AAB612_00915 [Patescibacteria group bacterium]